MADRYKIKVGQGRDSCPSKCPVSETSLRRPPHNGGQRTFHTRCVGAYVPGLITIIGAVE